jgi:ribosomal protein S12 methylthiotransferase accessory factor
MPSPADSSPRSSRPLSPPPPSARKRFRSGTHRLLAPEETVERARGLMHAMGITRVACVTGLDVLGIPVVTVCRPNARSVSVLYGKGCTLVAAKASGLMESIESYHAEHITLPLKLASFHELGLNHRVAGADSLPRVPASSFHKNARLLWIEGVDILQGSPAWLPFDMVHMSYTLPLVPGSGTCCMTSAGLASGNHLLEAISHGICELIEHDSTALWSLHGEEAQMQARIDLQTVDDPSCCAMLRCYERAGVDVAVWETTTDIGIASFLCTVSDRLHDPRRPIPAANGTACHPTREVALLSALTEAAETRVSLIMAARGHVRAAGADARERRGTDRPPSSRMQRSRPLRRFQDVPSYEGETVNDDVQWQLERLRAAGLAEVIVIDLTKREFNIPVVRVVIPGLEALRNVPGYDPGARASRIMLEGES